MGRIAPVCKGGVLDSTEGWGHLFADDEDGCGTFSVPVKNLWNSADAARFPGDIGTPAETPNTDIYYKLAPDAIPQDGVPKGEIKGPFTLPSKAYPGTQHTYWVYVPAQYD